LALIAPAIKYFQTNTLSLGLPGGRDKQTPISTWFVAGFISLKRPGTPAARPGLSESGGELTPDQHTDYRDES
jgi:hypothetical protein